MIEGAYSVLDVFEKSRNNIGIMKGIELDKAERLCWASWHWSTNMKTRHRGDPENIIHPRRWHDKGTDLWTAFNIVQENLVKGWPVGTH